MPKYPPVDSDFYAWGMAHNMSEADIIADWVSYCDGLERFHEEMTTIMGEPTPIPSFCVGGLD